MSKLRVVATVALIALLTSAAPSADVVAVRHPEGLVHGFLSLRSISGALLASGDLIQNLRSGRVTSRLVFRFKDGSLQEETAVFTQRGSFRLISSRLVQQGPVFKAPLEMTIDPAAGHVRVRYRSEDGELKVEDEHMDLPPDLANGMLITLLKNVRSDALPERLPLVVATPKPRLVTLKISMAGREPFPFAGSMRRATHYVLKMDLGGLAGLLAPLLGKDPPDAHVWILGGEAPAFVRSQAVMFAGGPVWQTELASPVWPRHLSGRTHSVSRRP